MPDASGKFKGISVPSIPWHEKGHGMTQRTDSTPAFGQVKANDRSPEVPLTLEDGVFRDEDGQVFSGWAWEGRDGCWYGQRARGMGIAGLATNQPRASR